MSEKLLDCIHTIDKLLLKAWIEKEGIWVVPSTMSIQTTGYFIPYEKMKKLEEK